MVKNLADKKVPKPIREALEFIENNYKNQPEFDTGKVAASSKPTLKKVIKQIQSLEWKKEKGLKRRSNEYNYFYHEKRDGKVVSMATFHIYDHRVVKDTLGLNTFHIFHVHAVAFDKLSKSNPLNIRDISSVTVTENRKPVLLKNLEFDKLKTQSIRVTFRDGSMLSFPPKFTTFPKAKK